VTLREEIMYRSLSFNQMAERDVQDFESDLKRYQAANRRSLWGGLLLLAVALVSACAVCSAIVLLLR
jgi:hypothetical protein